MATKKVIVYGRTKPTCTFCKSAVQTLENMGMDYTYKDLTAGEWDPETLGEELGVSLRTVPVIVIEDKHIGGFAELVEWIRDNSVEA